MGGIPLFGQNCYRFDEGEVCRQFAGSLPEMGNSHMIQQYGDGGGLENLDMSKPSKCPNCLLYGKECHPTPEQLAPDWQGCPYYDPVDKADRLARDVRLFGGVPARPKRYRDV